MNRKILLILGGLVFVLFTARSQTTYYYKLAKRIHNRIPSTNVSGGQFITFSGDVCFESTRGGIGVGHGKLSYNRNYSNHQIKIYIGNSYWGDKTTFRFSSDLATLNVATRGGDVYVYKRSTAPRGVTTCSLVRRPSTGGGSKSGGSSSPATPTFPSVGGYYAGGSPVGSSSTQSQQNSRERKWRDCSLCHGKGTIVRDSYSSTYGQSDPMVYCAECGRSWHQSTGHRHVPCPTCHGNRGFWSE